jgi:hypothetical protein
MGMAIVLRVPGDSDEFVGLVAGSPYIMPLLDEAERRVKESHPEIYEKAFYSFAWGEVYLDELDADELLIVYDITRSAYEEEMSARDNAHEPRDVGMPKNWSEYFQLLESDPRIADRIEKPLTR